MTNATILFPLAGILLIGLGWPMAARRARPNRWYGLRVPATLADEGVWYDANAVAGRDMVALGVAVVVVALGLPLIVNLPLPVYTGICGGILGIGSLIMTVHSWGFANRRLRERRGGG
jgi:SdpI/YfhL protein family